MNLATSAYHMLVNILGSWTEEGKRLLANPPPSSVRTPTEAERRQLPDGAERRRSTTESTIRLQYDDLRRKYRETVTHLASLEQEKCQLYIRAKHLEDEVLQLRDELANANALLGARTTELRSAEAFSGSLDKLPEDLVIQQVADINTEIMAISTTVAESFAFREDSGVRVTGSWPELAGVDFASRAFLDILATHTHVDDPTLVQFAIQSLLTYEAAHIFELWMPQADVSKTLQKTYDEIRREASPLIAARWRALTCQYTKHEESSSIGETQKYAADTVNYMTAILCMAGCDCGGQESIESRCKKLLAGRITSLWASVVDLGRKCRVDMVSAEYQVLYVATDEPFDGKFMQNMGSSLLVKPTPSRQETINCGTMSLGLCKRNNGGSTVNDVVLKSNVLVQADVHEVVASR